MNNLQKISRIAALAIFPALVWAHGGEDHSQDDKKSAPQAQSAPVPAAAIGDFQRATRLADGSVFLPKPMQRQAGLLTQTVEAGRFPRTFELAGKVIGDPSASGRVQATQAGRIEPGKSGLATVGRRVKAGEVLGILRPVASSLERGSQLAQVADLSAQLVLAERKLARAQQLEGLTPQKEIDASRIDVDGVKARLAALRSGLNSTEALVAPVSGVIAASHVVAGQVVEARELLFELVDPERLSVEALAYDAALVDRTTGGSVVLAGESNKRESARLNYLGGARQLREGALPLLFNVESGRGKVSSLVLAVGQSVSVLVETKDLLEGVVVPASALVRDANGDPQIWIKLDPERFTPRRVRTIPLDGSRVVVSEGIKAGERVVSSGASALALIR
jgi:RND family efflux transporter MFP subunit